MPCVLGYESLIRSYIYGIYFLWYGTASSEQLVSFIWGYVGLLVDLICCLADLQKRCCGVKTDERLERSQTQANSSRNIFQSSSLSQSNDHSISWIFIMQYLLSDGFCFLWWQTSLARCVAFSKPLICPWGRLKLQSYASIVCKLI